VSDNLTDTYETLRQHRDAYKNACETVHKENKAKLFDFLGSKSDIQSIHVEFNGSGDSAKLKRSASSLKEQKLLLSVRR